MSFNADFTRSLSTIVETLAQARDRSWMGIYLKILAVILAGGALVHYANIAGFGEKPWLETPLIWQVGDVAYAILDTVAAIGLWRQTPWGMLCFLFAIVSQFIIYTIFIDAFALTIAQQQTIYGLLIQEGILVGIFILLLVFKK